MNTVAVRALVVGLVLLDGMSMAPAAGDRDATRGKELYARYCTGCHGADGRGEAKTFRPNVGNLAVKEFLDQVSDEYLFTAIKLGGVAVGKTGRCRPGARSSTMTRWGCRGVRAHAGPPLSPASPRDRGGPRMRRDRTLFALATALGLVLAPGGHGQNQGVPSSGGFVLGPR